MEVVESVNGESDHSIIEYNQYLQSHALFKRNFELEKNRYKLALQNSINDMLTRLPIEIKQMNAAEYLNRVCEDDDF
jgi:hypothetical protein